MSRLNALYLNLQTIVMDCTSYYTLAHLGMNWHVLLYSIDVCTHWLF